MKWISVEERLPANGEFVLCAFDDGLDYWRQLQEGIHDGFGQPKMKKGYSIRQLKTDDGKRWADEGVTHWMKLPEPPEP